MAFTGDGQKLVGDDGFLQLATQGATVDGDGATPLPDGTYLVTKVAGASGFPAAASGGTATAVGDILIIESPTTAVTPVVGDTVITLTMADQCDIRSWGMQFSKEEIETTVLCDSVKKYRAGKSDMQGSLEGVFVVGTTEASTGLLRQFIDIAQQDGGASFDRFEQQESILLGFFYTNDDTNVADKQYVVAAVQFYGEGLGGQLGNAQTFESSFRFGDLTLTDGNGDSATITPTYYRLGNG